MAIIMDFRWGIGNVRVLLIPGLQASPISVSILAILIFEFNYCEIFVAGGFNL